MSPRLADVNTTAIAAAIRLGCRCMGRTFNAPDADRPFFGARVRPVAELRGSSESHLPGRHLNAEDAVGVMLDEEDVDKHAHGTLFSYSQAPLPLHRVGYHAAGAGALIRLADHDLREETLTRRDQAVRARFRGAAVNAMQTFDQNLTFFDPL